MCGADCGGDRGKCLGRLKASAPCKDAHLRSLPWPMFPLLSSFVDLQRFLRSPGWLS